MNKIVTFLFILGFLLSSCSTSIKTTIYQHRPGISYGGQIPIFTLTDELPKKAQIIGELRFNGNLDNDCRTEDLIQDISIKAKEKGANAIKIINYMPNNDLCPDVYAYLVYLDDIDEYQSKEYKVISDSEKAIIHFYRRSFADLHTQFQQYSVHINKNATVELRNRSKSTIVAEPGFYSFELENGNQQINMNLEAGKSYFIRVSVIEEDSPNFGIDDADMNLVDPLVGIIEFESFNNRRAQSFHYKNYSIYNQENLIENEELQTNINSKFKLFKKYDDHIVYKDYVHSSDSIYATDFSESSLGYSSIENDISVTKNENLFVQFYLGYNTSSFSFKDAYVKINPENFPSIEEQLEPSTIMHGIDLGAGFGTEKGFILMDIWFLEGERFNRGRDMVSGVSLGFGGRYAIVRDKNHYINWGLGIGGNDLSRGIYRQGNLTATLRNRKWAFTPQLKYEYQIPKTKISIYTQARLVHVFGNVSKHSGVQYEERNLGRHQDRTETTEFRFRSPELEVDTNGRLNYGNRIDFSFGLMYNM